MQKQVFFHLDADAAQTHGNKTVTKQLKENVRLLERCGAFKREYYWRAFWFSYKKIPCNFKGLVLVHPAAPLFN